MRALNCAFALRSEFIDIYSKMFHEYEVRLLRNTIYWNSKLRNIWFEKLRGLKFPPPLLVDMQYYIHS
jgi:hypothetical protein